jgi:predicted RNase H-like HicB family nuclease
MKTSDRYHKWVEWNEEDSAYVGQCPDLITGIHGDDPVKLFAELEQTLEDVIAHFKAESRPLPSPRTGPMQEVA